ncbi:TetR/AcrR family transcriptional regulator [Pseudonocardia endophytica]|uniref:TetR family transcriptional regulator n=1 Tax=Pseudonocardia endophytica TaxID=401976 RepID=A0A4R1HXS3_PSEEN|nr:TetR/AcrR family transcriptional regulator [Pseudonocardia endophytica]TCK26291.1 TetR family transcriptional regulator [Pseudonocardia endophytica]
MPPRNGGTSGRTRPTRAQTRRRVLDAAFTVFGQRGIAGSSLDDVAAEAGLTKGAVYSSFTGKDDLVLALIEEHAFVRLNRVIDRIGDVPDTQSVLADVASTLVEAMHVDAAAHRILAEYFALSHRDPERREALRRTRATAREAVARGVEQFSTRTGITPALPPEQMAVMLFALSNGLGVESAIDPQAVPADLLGRVLALLVARPDTDGAASG